MRLVAVYGSLREGLHNHHVLNGADMLDTGEIEGYNMYSLGAYPALVPVDTPTCPIKVEVYEVNEPTFIALDRLEGYPTFYNRDVVDVVCEDGSVMPCWVYYMRRNLADHQQVMNGDWKDFLEKVA